jgi:cytochrome c553
MKKLIVLVIIVAAVLVVYNVLMYYDNNFPFGRMRETPGIKPHEEPILIMEAGIIPFEGGESIYRAMDGKKIKSPLQMGADSIIAQGKQGYLTYCAQCHGNYHDGNGTVGQSFAPLPGDLRSEKVQLLPEGVMFKEISYGIPNGRQPALATTIAVEERWKIIAYIKSLGIRK